MTSSPFRPDDLAQLEARGIGLEEAAEQIALLRDPPPAIVLDRPATPGDGVVRIGEAEQLPLIAQADAAAADGRVMKFVPASGAATRMFKDLIAVLQSDRRPSELDDGRRFFQSLHSFPFAEELLSRAGLAGAPASEEEERRVLRTLLGGMRYAQKPKGLIPMHRTDRVRTAFEEHLLEGARYARSADGTCRLHFTVAPEYRGEFEAAAELLGPHLERTCPGTTFLVTFSEQDPSTDTLAIDSLGVPVRTPDGALLFRPGGHGALIRNLEATGGDVVVIKNVDNVLPDHWNGEVVHWKKILVGLLVRVQKELFDIVSGCADPEAGDDALDRGIAFAASSFSRRPGRELRTRDEKRRFVLDALDRPLRICGVVKNEGEPGGAPFWVVAADGSCSVQIVESAQVDPASVEQQRIFRSSTHFNPVDVVCGLRSWRGEAFDLSRFVDRRAVFLSRKSFEGRELFALERPGLWNGAMAGWNTICVEVPASTFAPVKTVFDLLRPQHLRK